MNGIFIALVTRFVITGKITVGISRHFETAEDVMIVLHTVLACLYKLFPLVGIAVVVTNTEHLKTFVMIFFVKLLNVRKRCTAGTTPCCPEVNEDHFTLKVRKFLGLTFVIYAYKVGSGLAGLNRCKSVELLFYRSGSRLNLGSERFINRFKLVIAHLAHRILQKHRDIERTGILGNEFCLNFLSLGTKFFRLLIQGVYELLVIGVILNSLTQTI